MSRGSVPQPWTKRAAQIRVLIADPNECLLAEYQEFLWVDFELVTAASGVECAARLRERIPDVLVLEPQLPWGGGDGVLAMMREVPDLSIVRVMILTSCRDPSVLKSVAPFRISDYCRKPVSPDQLAKRIRSVLDHRRLRGASAYENDRLTTRSERRSQKATVGH